MQEVIVHSIMMGDVEDPDLFVAEPIYKWQQTDEGKWIMKNSLQQPMWRRVVDQATYGHRYDIIAYLEGSNLTYWKLKYE